HTRSKRDWSSDVCSSDLTCQNCDDSAGDNRRNTKCIFYHVCNGVTLCTVTDTEAGKTSEQREQNAKPFLFQASFQSIHRTTDHTAVFTFNSVLDSQNSFTIFGSNTEAACQPYPEYRTRTTGCDRCSNADDVTGT